MYPKPLPTIPVTVPEKHYRLKHGVVKTGEGRHIIIQGLLTDLFRDERIEVEAHRAVQARAYAERVLSSIYIPFMNINTKLTKKLSVNSNGHRLR